MKASTIYRLGVEHKCPWCGHVMDSATDTTPDKRRRPRVDDQTICIECGEWAIFTKPMPSLRKPTEDEFIEIGQSKECAHMRWAWVQMDADRRR